MAKASTSRGWGRRRPSRSSSLPCFWSQKCLLNDGNLNIFALLEVMVYNRLDTRRFGCFIVADQWPTAARMHHSACSCLSVLVIRHEPFGLHSSVKKRKSLQNRNALEVGRQARCRSDLQRVAISCSCRCLSVRICDVLLLRVSPGVGHSGTLL